MKDVCSNSNEKYFANLFGRLNMGLGHQMNICFKVYTSKSVLSGVTAVLCFGIYICNQASRIREVNLNKIKHKDTRNINITSSAKPTRQAPTF